MSHRHVHYILVSEFDIDKGSSLAHQYPSATGADEHLLAELMLPDGVHNREEDWTIFFLNQKPSENDGTKSVKALPSEKKPPPVTVLDAFVYEFTESNQGWTQLGNNTMKLHLEPNAIRIQGDGDFNRSLPRDPELQHQSMEALFHCVIVGDVAFGFRFAEQLMELTFEAHCEELRKSPDEAAESALPAAPSSTSSSAKADASAEKPFLYVLTLIRNKRVENVRRGAVVKSIAICTPHPWLHVYKPLLLLAMDRYFKTPEVSVLAELYDAVNAMDISAMPNLSVTQRLMLRTSADKEKQIFTTSVPYMKINIPVRIPLTTLEDEIADPSVTKLITHFNTGIMLLFNALLLEKRIIFVGYGRAANEVVNYVLAACQLISPPIKGITKRCFPYTNLTNLSFMEFRGYLVGVTNPVFRDNSDWWDVLCNIETAKVIANPKYFSQSETERHVAADAEFINEVLAKIEGHVAEEHIRQMFTDYTQRIVEIAMNDAEFADEAAKKKEVETNFNRVELFKKTYAFQQYSKERHESRAKRTITAVDAEKHIQKLRVRKALSAQEIYSIFKDFNTHITTEVQLIELLTYLPENQGGLYPIAVSLLHPSENVRRATAELFHRLSKVEAGRDMINNLNVFLKTAYERSKSLLVGK